MTDPAASPSKLETLDRHWLRWTTLIWLVLIGWYLWQRWNQVRWLGLSDTDDNMRFMQVRAWMMGQSWWDLRQYRLDPPRGLDIHWSRLVDLPIAGLQILLRPFAGPAWAEKLSAGIAPLLPLGVAMAALGAIARRLIAPLAWPLAIVMLLSAAGTMLMFMPMRIDHHGWQLALLAVTVMGLTDPARARGGATVGISSALSFAIGLEMLPYCAIAGAIVALRWVWDAAERPRLLAYAVALGGGTALAFAAFASNANQVMRCDALTPVYLATFSAAAAFLALCALVSPPERWQRLALAGVYGMALAGGFAAFFPQCLGRPEQVSPELYDLWLSHVREARPIYQHPWRSGLATATLPIIGLIGAGFATWRARGTPALIGWVAVAACGLFACVMLLWQVRAGPAAQLLAVPGATALAWAVLPKLRDHKSMLVRVFGTAAAFLLISGLFAGLILKVLPAAKPSEWENIVNRANTRCPTFSAMRPLNALPKQTVFTFVDLGPRLIVLTHHNGIAGPYHRNEAAILDVHHAFMGSPEQFRRIAAAHGATLLMICPRMGESTLYQAKAKKGFYSRLARGEPFPFLEPVAMPNKSPLRVWKIK